MGDIQKPTTTKWKKRNVNKPKMKYAEQDSLNTMTDKDRTEPFVTDIVDQVNIGLDNGVNESPLHGVNESSLLPLHGVNESSLLPLHGVNELPLHGVKELPLHGGKSSKSIDMMSPFNMTSAPLQTIFDNVLYINNYEKITEGLDNIANDTNKNLAKDAFKKAMEFMEKWLFNVLEFILIKGPTLMINKITDGICGNGNDFTPIEKDVVKTHVKEYFVLLITCYITYNWYYVMFYPRKLLPRPILKINTDNLTNTNKWLSLVFKYLIVPVSLVNSILLKKTPFVIRPFGKKFKFLFLFHFIPKIIMKHGASIARAFLDSIRQKKTKFDGIIIAIMVIFGVTSVLRVRLSINYFSELFRFYSQMAIFFIPIFILFALRIVFSTMHPWIAGILVFGYLLIMSFFAMNIYGETADTLSVIKLIDKYILYKNPKHKPKPCDFDYYDNSGCAPMPFFVRMNKLRLDICDFLFKYKYETAFLMFFVKSLYDYIFYLKTGTHMKQYLVVLTFFGILICLTSFGYRFWFDLIKNDGAQKEDNDKKLKIARESAMKGCGTRGCLSEDLKSNDLDDDDGGDFQDFKPETSIFGRLFKTVTGDEDDDSDDSDSDDDGFDEEDNKDFDEMVETITPFLNTADIVQGREIQTVQGRVIPTVQGHVISSVNPEIAVTNTTLNAAKGLLNM
jgi:hypothetical protein